MWYVLQADRNAQLISGFNQKISKEQYTVALANHQLKEILRFEEVTTQDVFFIPSGKIHALGPGLLIAEIQQTSDNTFRVYDWDRLDDKGKGRQLHTEEALQAIDFEDISDAKTRYKIRPDGTTSLVNCPFFTTQLIDVKVPLRKDYSEIDSFVILLCVEGACKITFANGADTLQLSETLLIPNLIEGIDIYPHQHCKLLEVFIS